MRTPQDTSKNNIPFELFAPRNQEVFLLGSWNRWQPIEMQRGDDGRWRVEVALPDGEHEYKFQLISKSGPTAGQRVTVADPKALRFSRESDSSRNSIVKVKDGKRVSTVYKWQHNHAPLPSNEQLIIYEMHIGDFRGGPGDIDDESGDFSRVLEKLDYLADLGVNALQLMPVNETAADNYWGYSQRSIYAVENTYGTPDELCQLIDECHARGIRVIHDGVFNHVVEHASLAKIDYTYWFYEDNPDEPELQFGPKFNYEYYDEKLKAWPAREHAMGAIELWVSEFCMDGIRFDSARAIKHFDVMRCFNEVAHKWAGSKPFLTIAEYLAQNPAITGPDGPLDAAWHENYYRQLISTALGINYEGHEPFVTTEILRLFNVREDGFASAYNTVHYLNNHDQERLMYLLGAKANIFDDAAFRRCKLGAGLLLTSPGIPMLWMGEEFGQATPKSEKRQPLHWSLLENERNKMLWEHYRHLIHLRKTNPALYSDNFETIANIPERGIIAFKRWNDEGNIVVVVANLFPHAAGEVEIPLAGIEDGRWCEEVYNYEIEAHQNRLVDCLGESELKIYVKQ